MTAAAPATASLIIVNYRSSSLAREAVQSARETTTTPLQIIVVDNSADAAELSALEECRADIVLAASANRGYGAGVNLGRTRATGEAIVASNPDVVFHAGCIDYLVGALAAPVGICGPALFWDDGLTWHLPPAERAGLVAAIAGLIASRSGPFRRLRDQQRVLRRIAFWTARSPVTTSALSGAVLAIRRDLFDALEGFDERFFLYFEEHDLIRRAAGRGWQSRYIPLARCRHVYNQSARSSSEARGHYAASERRFLADGIAGRGAVLAQRLTHLRAAEAFPESETIVIDGHPEDFVVEASPLPGFETAAGYLPHAAVVAVPPEVWRMYRDPALYLRTVRRRSGEQVAAFVRKNL